MQKRGYKLKINTVHKVPVQILNTISLQEMVVEDKGSTDKA